MPYKYGQDAGLSQTGKRLRHDKLAKESGKMVDRYFSSRTNRPM